MPLPSLGLIWRKVNDRLKAAVCQGEGTGQAQVSEWSQDVFHVGEGLVELEQM